MSRWGFGFSTVSRDFVDDFARAIHLDDPGIARLGDHGVAIVEALKGVNLDPALVTGLGFGLVAPDFLAGSRDFNDCRRAGRIQEVAVGQECEIVNFRLGRDCPFHLAFRVDQGHVALIGRQNAVVRLILSKNRTDHANEARQGECDAKRRHEQLQEE